MAYYFGVEEDEVAAKHLTDPLRRFRATWSSMRANPLIPRTLIASAVMYDIASGRVEVISPPAPLGETGEMA